MTLFPFVSLHGLNLRNLQLPFNNDCARTNSMLTNLSMVGRRVEIARNTEEHVKKTLPPSLNGFPGEAEIRYFVKVTVQRPSFFKENFRAVSVEQDCLSLS